MGTKPKAATGAGVMFSTRVRPEVAAAIDDDRKRRGWTRREWLERLAERALPTLRSEPVPPPERAPAGKPGTRGGRRDVEPRFGGKVKGA